MVNSDGGGGQICLGSRGFPPHWRQQGGEREREMTGKLASSPQFLAPGAPKLTSPKKSKDLRAVEILLDPGQLQLSKYITLSIVSIHITKSRTGLLIA